MARLGVNITAVAPGGPVAATWQDTTAQFHELVVLETQSGAGDPVAVGASNPLPTQFLTAQSVIGNVASSGVDSGFGVKVSGVYNITPPALTSGWRGDLQLDANGNLLVNLAVGGGTGGTASTFQAALPTLGTAIGAQSASGALMQPLNLDGGGNLKVNVAAGSLQAVTDNASAFTSGTTQAVPVAWAYNDSASAVTTGNMGIPRITANRQIRVVQDASANGGLTPYGLVQPGTPAATSIKASAGQVGWIHASNDQATPVYVKWFNTVAGSVTLGTTSAVFQTEIPGNTGGAGYTVSIPQGLTFSTAIVYAVTGAIGFTDNTAITATKVNLAVGYA